MDDEQQTGPVPVPDTQGRTSALLLSGALVLVLVSGGAGYLVDRGATTTGASTAVAVTTPPDTGTGSTAAGTGSDTGSDPASGSPSVVAAFGGYANPRFGFHTLYPADFTAQTQSADGDGMQWVGGTEGMTTFTAYGANNPDGATPAQELDTLSQGIVVTYSRVKGDVVTVSGLRDGDTVVYVRAVVGPGSTATMAWTYPVAEKDRWGPAVTATAAAFTPGDLSTSH